MGSGDVPDNRPEEEDVTMMFCPLGCTCPCHTGKAFQQNEYDKQISNLLLQVEELQKKVSEQRKMLWWCARDAGLCLHIPKAELESIPESAELLVWYEKLFDSMALKGICSPTGQGEPVVEKTTPGKRKDEPCYCCGPRYDHKAGQCQEAMRVKRLNDERA